MSVSIAGSMPTFSRPKNTQTAGTVISSLVQPHKKARTKLTYLSYTNSTTAHTLTVLKALARTSTTTAAAGAATAIVLTRDPGNYSANFAADALAGPNTRGVQSAGQVGLTPVVANNLLAANHWLVIANANRDFFFLAQVSGTPTTNADGTVSVTLVSGVPTGGVPAGATVFFLGATTDSHPVTGEAHSQFALVVSTTTVLSDVNGGEIASSFGLDEPILIQSNNLTAAGTLNNANGVYGLQ